MEEKWCIINNKQNNMKKNYMAPEAHLCAFPHFCESLNIDPSTTVYSIESKKRDADLEEIDDDSFWSK